MIRILIVSAALLGGLVATTPVTAQGLTRAQVQMDRDAFFSMFQWEEINGMWVMKEGMTLPPGVKSRDEVMAMTVDFLRMNRWDNANSEWIPTGGKPRDMSLLTRDQVHMETVRFVMTHRFDENTQQWISKTRGR